MTTQQLAELEEVLVYKEQPKSRIRIGQMWRERLSGCSNTVQLWEQLLAVRKLAMAPAEDPTSWAQFATLCRKTGRLQQAKRVIQMVMSESTQVPYMVRYCHAKCTKLDQGHSEAEREMTSLAADIQAELSSTTAGAAHTRELSGDLVAGCMV